MSERGVFAVDRGIWSDTDFADEQFSEREAFLWLLGEAAWRPTRVRIGSSTVDLARGQCAFSTRFMAQRWKWSEARVRRYLGRLQKSQIIDACADARATLVTICKYDRFQRVSLPTDAPVDAEATQQRRTGDAAATQQRRKEEDRENREDIDSSLRSEPRTRQKRPSRSAVDRDWKLSAAEIADGLKCGVQPSRAAEIWPAFIDHHLKEGSKFLDWPAAWRTWCRNDVKFAARDRRFPARASPGRQSTADLWAGDAIDAHLSRQRGQDDRGPFFDSPDERPAAEPHRDHPGSRSEDGGSYGLSDQQSRNDPRQLPALRLVGGMRSDW